jgi:hypothetical protein
MVEMDEDLQIYRTQQENFKKKLCKYGKSRFLIPRLHFSMVLLWGNGVVTFTRFHEASTTYYALFRLLRASAVQKV